MPGDNTPITVEIIHPMPWTKASASHREGGRTVASGRVTKILK